MMKFVAAACAAILGGAVLAGTSGEAEARCRTCGPIAPSYVYKTVRKVSHATRYRDVTRTSYVTRVHPIVHVTRVQPVVRIHDVTRIHHRTVPVVRPVYVSRTQYLPTRYVTTRSVQHSYQCGCYR